MYSMILLNFNEKEILLEFSFERDKLQMKNQRSKHDGNGECDYKNRGKENIQQGDDHESKFKQLEINSNVSIIFQ
jgi:hypothetical protein